MKMMFYNWRRQKGKDEFRLMVQLANELVDEMLAFDEMNRLSEHLEKKARQGNQSTI